MQSSLLRCVVASLTIVQVTVGLFTKPASRRTSSQGKLAAGLWLADEGAARQPSAKVYMARARELVENNLGGQGPGNGTNQVMRFSPMLKVGRSYVDLVVSAQFPVELPYQGKNPEKNGWSSDSLKQLGQINVKGRKPAALKFSFQDSDTGNPVDMPPYNITFFDIDGRKNNRDAESLSISTDVISGYMLFPTTNVTFFNDSVAKVATFTANSWGRGCDNPGRLENLGPRNCTYEKDEPKKEVDPRSYAVVLYMNGGSEFNITYKLDSGGGGNFFFAVPTSFGDYDLEPAPGSTPAVEESVATPSPTTTPGGSVSEFGDPHVSNINHERFDILSVGTFTFLAIPDLTNEVESALQVQAKVEVLGALCEGRLYVTRLWFAGEWLGELRSLDFATKLSQDEMDTGMDNAMQIKLGNGAAAVDVSGLLAAAPTFPVEVTEFHPDKPQDVNEHVTMALIKLTLGPAIFKVRHVLQREKSGFSNALWLSASGLEAVDSEIHGLLGKDDHTLAASLPQECAGSRKHWGSAWSGVHASASLDSDDD